jgi:hypothetical protein
MINIFVAKKDTPSTLRFGGRVGHKVGICRIFTVGSCFPKQLEDYREGGTETTAFVFIVTLWCSFIAVTSTPVIA